MKKIKYIIIFIFMLLFVNNVNAFDTSSKVYDYAQILTPEEEKQLKMNIDLYIANHNMDMAIVTVKYHEKTNTMNYADDFYDYNGFGVGSNSDGVIFVLDFTFWDNGELWMSTTGRAIDIYTDSRINSILDSVVAKKNYGYYEMFNTFINKSDYYAQAGAMNYNNSQSQNINWAVLVLIWLAVPTLVIVILVVKNKMIKKSLVASHYLLKDTVKINKRSDKFITTHTTSVRISDTTSSGGSSSHRSSSGRSHGGGGRRL